MLDLNPCVKLLPEGPTIEIDGGSLYLGRDCILALRVPELRNKAVSNRHLRVWLHQGQWLLQDLGSTNGTYVGGTRLQGRVALIAGVVFSLGRSGPRFQWMPPERNPAAGATIPEDVPSMAETLSDDRDGSDERPYRVGRTPEVVLEHLGTGVEFRALGYTLILGRDPGAAHVLVRSADERHVSARHAELRFTPDGMLMLRDLDSRNGTFLNGERLEHEAAVAVGDIITLGLDVTSLLVKAINC